MSRRSRFYSPFVVGATLAFIYTGWRVKQHELNNSNMSCSFNSGLRTSLHQ